MSLLLALQGGGDTTTLLADAGSYVYTGSDAELYQNAFLAEEGAYLLTGTDADLIAPLQPLAAEAGEYILSGTDALLGQSAFLAEAGAYNYTGSDAELLYGFRIDGNAGAYVYTGTSIQELFTMFAEAGSYLLTGGAINPPELKKFKRVPWVTDKPERRVRSWPRSGSRYPKKWP